MGKIVLLFTLVFFHANALGSADIYGFLQYHDSQRIDRGDCTYSLENCDKIAQSGALNLSAEGYINNNFAYYANLETRYDAISDKSSVKLREAYMDYAGSNTLMRAGRQIITWGVGDLLFINDTFPKNWAAFYSGSPTQYMKLGSDAVSGSWFFGASSIDLIVSEFRANELPNSENHNLSSMPEFQVDAEPDEAELSLKASSTLGQWEVTGYMSRTHFRSPSSSAADPSRSFYPRLNTYGASLTGPFVHGLLSVEAGYHKVPNKSEIAVETEDQKRWLLGYSQQISGTSNIGVQIYEESAKSFNSNNRELATLRFTKSFRYQTIRLNIFAFYGLTDNDSYLIPSLRYTPIDVFWVEIGSNSFRGDRSTPFGSVQENSNLFFTLRYSF